MLKNTFKSYPSEKDILSLRTICFETLMPLIIEVEKEYENKK